jgi:hypothetical protein
MAGAYRIDKLYRASHDDIAVVFVIRKVDCTPRSAWIANEETRVRYDESADELVQRALHRYRATHPAERGVAALVVDCSR